MAVRLSTTVSKIASLPNATNAALISEFYQYMKNNGASESHTNNSLKTNMGVKQVVNLLTFANEDLPTLEKRIKRLRNDISMLQFQKRIDGRNLYQLNNQIATTSKLLNSFRMSCERERREIENLYNEKTSLKAIVTGFKSNNEEYLDKIKQAACEEVKSVLRDSKLILKFATFSVIESSRSNPELYNFVIHDISNTTISYGSNYPSLILSGRQHQQSFNDSYIDLILQEAEKLYNDLTTKLTNSVIAAAAASIRAASSSPSTQTNQPYYSSNSI